MEYDIHNTLFFLLKVYIAGQCYAFPDYKRGEYQASKFHDFSTIKRILTMIELCLT